MKPNQTIKCPKDPGNNYFVETCQTIFLKTGFRHWCRDCHHFVQSRDLDKQTIAKEKKEAS